MNKGDLVRGILAKRSRKISVAGKAAAAANIALCKYWGKRNQELNLPTTSSLSISLGSLGTQTAVEPAEKDRILFNGETISAEHPLATRLLDFIRMLCGKQDTGILVNTKNSIATGAGLASSASGFAALVKALDLACGWHLPPRDLSILARLGSGSATRSVFDGFVQWHRGAREDGLDSFAEPLPHAWRELRVGILTVLDTEKPVGSTTAMNRTTKTSPLYQAWPDKVARDLPVLLDAIENRDFQTLGETAESNALSMHATMIAAKPPVMYWQPESVAWMHRIWDARANGLPLYFTMDAGPNIKLLFLKKMEADVLNLAPHTEVVDPWAAHL